MEGTEEDDGVEEGSSVAEREGSASNGMTDAASACDSFCEVAGREAGATGTEGASRFTQQTGVAQCLLSQPLQQQLFFAPCVVAPMREDDAMTPCQARINPSSATTAILIGRDVMFSDWSL